MGTLRVHRHHAAPPPETERAGGAFVFVVLAGIVPVLLGGILETLAQHATPAAGSAAAAVLPLLLATATLVRWVGTGVLVALAAGCAVTATYHFRRSHGPALRLSEWTLAEAYAAAAVAALLGLYWLA